MLGILKKNVQSVPEIATVGEADAAELEPAADVELLFAQRAYRPDNRRADYLKVAYRAGERAKELTVEIPWESLAQLRSAMAREGRELNDDEVLGYIVVPWALGQVPAMAPDDLPNVMRVTLDFGDGPRPPAVREMLIRYSQLPFG